MAKQSKESRRRTRFSSATCCSSASRAASRAAMRGATSVTYCSCRWTECSGKGCGLIGGRDDTGRDGGGLLRRACSHTYQGLQYLIACNIVWRITDALQRQIHRWLAGICKMRIFGEIGRAWKLRRCAAAVRSARRIASMSRTCFSCKSGEMRWKGLVRPSADAVRRCAAARSCVFLRSHGASSTSRPAEAGRSRMRPRLCCVAKASLLDASPEAHTIAAPADGSCGLDPAVCVPVLLTDRWNGSGLVQRGELSRLRGDMTYAPRGGPASTVLGADPDACLQMAHSSWSI